MSTTRTFYGYGNGNNPIEAIATARTLTDGDHGKVFSLNAAAGAAITLPAVKPGLKFKFVVDAAFATTDWTVVTNGSANIIQGNIIVAGAHVAAADEDTVSFVATAESIGDYVEFECDGTDWNISGSGVTAGSITATQAS